MFINCKELGCIYQKNGEDVVTYANRVKMLGKQILEGYKGAGSTLLDQNIKASLEKDMNKCFIRGLKPEIEQRIARNLDIQNTVTDALRIERELREMTDLRQGPMTDSGKDNLHTTTRIRETCQYCLKDGHMASNCRRLPQPQLQNYNKPRLGTEILICQICKKRGHSADKCRFRDPQSRQTVNLVQEKSITCQLCSKSGHNAKTCRQNNNNNVTNKTSLICQWCDKLGHSLIIVGGNKMKSVILTNQISKIPDNTKDNDEIKIKIVNENEKENNHKGYDSQEIQKESKVRIIIKNKEVKLTDKNQNQTEVKNKNKDKDCQNNTKTIEDKIKENNERDNKTCSSEDLKNPRIQGGNNYPASPK
ncbi:hypothetical protein ACFW04_013392 [Cataglyphis niger]